MSAFRVGSDTHPREAIQMTRQAIAGDLAPALHGPYSQPIIASGFVCCFGMAGIDPATGAIPGASRLRPSRLCPTCTPCSQQLAPQ